MWYFFFSAGLIVLVRIIIVITNIWHSENRTSLHQATGIESVMYYTPHTFKEVSDHLTRILAVTHTLLV